MTRTRVLAALLAGLTLAGIGTAATAFAGDDPATAPVSTVAQARPAVTPGTSTPTPTPDAGTSAAITADEAGSRAVAHLGAGTVTKIERETEHGRTVWEVDVRRDARVTEVHVDVATGAVTRVEDDDRGRDDRGRHGGDDRYDRDDRGGRHGGDDGPGHDLFDDKGGDR